MDRRQLVRVQLAQRGLHGGVAVLRGLEQQAELALLLQRPLPGIEALDRRDLRAGGEAALDQRTRKAPRVLAPATALG